MWHEFSDSQNTDLIEISGSNVVSDFNKILRPSFVGYQFDFFCICIFIMHIYW